MGLKSTSNGVTRGFHILNCLDSGLLEPKVVGGYQLLGSRCLPHPLPEFLGGSPERWFLDLVEYSPSGRDFGGITYLYEMEGDVQYTPSCRQLLNHYEFLVRLLLLFLEDLRLSIYSSTPLITNGGFTLVVAPNGDLGSAPKFWCSMTDESARLDRLWSRKKSKGPVSRVYWTK